LKSVRVAIISSLVLVLTLLSLAGRCFYLQYFRRTHYDEVSRRQQQKFVYQNPQRGEILDCCGRVLGGSNKYQIIKVEPRLIRNPEALAVALAPIVDIEAIEIYKRITESRNPGFAKIKMHASAAECAAIRKFYGVGVESDWARYYPMGSLASHVVGFASSDNNGLEGVELQYHKELSGISRRNVFFADSARRPIRLKQTGEFKDGSGVILTIDATIQQFTRAALMKQYEKFEAESALAVVADAKTGAILSMVSLPDYDPGNRGSAVPGSLRNRALTDQFEPGSIMKPITVAIALDAGVVSRTEKIYCEDGTYIGKGFGRIGEYRGYRYGNMTVRQILIKSSNIGAAKLGQKLGKKRLYRGMSLLGFGKKTGIDLPGETTGSLAHWNTWTGYSVTRIPFGQEITVTSLQLIRAYCMLASGGKMIRPFVVRGMIDEGGKVIKVTRPVRKEVGYVIDPDVAKWVISDAMAAVVNEGTGKRAKLEKWQVFGKTGTANIAKTGERGYSQENYVASFVAGAPADDPAIVVVISVRKPKKSLGLGYTGGVVASPAAKTIIEKTLTYLKVPERISEDVEVARR
jgi:cell division protein FtsI (penicillin-binding protein 3)